MAGSVLLDHRGREIRASSDAFHAAGTGRRVAHWFPPSYGPNTLAAGNLDILRNRARHEVRDNPWGAKVARAYASTRIGKGIRPTPQVEDPELRRQLSDAWRIWVQEADADGTTTFYGLQKLAATSIIQAGEIFYRWRPRRPEDGLHIPLQLQALESELCDETKTETLPGGRVIRAGVEFGPFGRRQAYWMHKEHPGEFATLARYRSVSPVPARDILHVYHAARPGQVRGLPGLAPVLGMLREINDTRDAFALKLKIQNLFATFETVPASTAGSVLDPNPNAETAADGGTDTAAVEPGTHQTLAPGHDIVFAKPDTATTPVVAWLQEELRAVATGVGLTYEQVTGDLSSVNFSSIRAGVIELWRDVEAEVEHTFNFQLNGQVWPRVVQTAILAGRVPAALDVEPAELAAAMWPEWTMMPGREYIQPLQEAQANALNLAMGLTSRTRESAKRGMDVEQLDREIAQDRERERALGLTFGTATTAAATAAAGAVPASDDDDAAPAPPAAAEGVASAA